jgi:polyisoprenyl-phosphate glycosyltransferase
VTGQALLYSSNQSNVEVRHEARAVGQSNYNLARIIRLVLTILFSYSSYPLRLAAFSGFCVAALSFVIGGVYLILGLFGKTEVQGWTTLVVLLAIFNGFTIALLSMLGEYVLRTLNAVSQEESYHVVERVSG